MDLRFFLKPFNWRTWLVLFAIFLLQLTVVPLFSFWEIGPDLLLLFVAFWGLILDRNSAIFCAFLTGLLKDFLTNGYFGLETTSFVIAALILIEITIRFDRTDRWVQIWGTFIFVFSELLIFYFLSTTVEDKSYAGMPYFFKSFLIAVYTTIFSPFSFSFLKSIFGISELPARQYELF